jgi:hypothetical protein
LVRFSLEQQPMLAPFADSVTGAVQRVADGQSKRWCPSSALSRLAWLNLIREHIATAISIETEKRLGITTSSINQHAGPWQSAPALRGNILPGLLDEL